MAVTEMKKFTVICQARSVDTLIRKLMWLSCVDIKQADEEGLEGITLEKIADIDSQLAEYNRTLQKLKDAMALLAAYDTKAWREHITMKAKRRAFSPPAQVDFDEFVDSGRYDIALGKLEVILNLSRL